MNSIRIDVMRGHWGHTMRIVECVVHTANGKFKGYELWCIDCRFPVTRTLEDNPIKEESHE